MGTVKNQYIKSTSTHIQLGLVEYANNATAIGAGLVVGDLYILTATKAVTVVV